jgi:hypothetical protein
MKNPLGKVLRNLITVGTQKFVDQSPVKASRLKKKIVFQDMSDE